MLFITLIDGLIDQSPGPTDQVKHALDPTPRALTRPPIEPTDPRASDPTQLSHFSLLISHITISSVIFWFRLVILLPRQSFYNNELNHSATVNSVILL
jgi:hypothetical protein